jgi:hypothetical protein
MIKSEEDIQFIRGRRLDALLAVVQESSELWNGMNRIFDMDENRWEVLRGIFTGFAVRQNEELLSETYRYGSMLKSEDLLGRQVFLWLLGILEENRKQRILIK